MAKAKRKRDNLGAGRALVTVIIIVLAITIVLVLRNIISLHLEQRELKAQETDLQNKKDELTAELKNIDDLDYIEEQARKLLRMIKPGEILYVLNGEDPRPEHSDSSDNSVAAPTPAVQEPEEETYQDYTYEEPVYEEDYTEETYEEPVEEEYVAQEEPEYSEQGEEAQETEEDYQEDSSEQGE